MLRPSELWHNIVLAYAAIACGAKDRCEEVVGTIRQLVAEHPKYTLSALRQHLPYAREADRIFEWDVLERAGLPD